MKKKNTFKKPQLNKKKVKIPKKDKPLFSKYLTNFTKQETNSHGCFRVQV